MSSYKISWNALAVLLVALYSMIATAVASTIDPEEAKLKALQSYEWVRADSVIAAIIIIITGLFVCFLGSKLVKFVIAVVGFLTGLYLTFLIFEAVNTTNVLGEKAGMIELLVGIAVGIVFCVLFFCFYKFAIFAVGAFAMVSLAQFLIFPHLIGISMWVRWLLFFIFAVIGGVLAKFFEKPVLICSTAVIGSASTFSGIDIFAKTGLIPMFRAIVVNRAIMSMSGASWGLVAGFIVLSVLGIFVQFKFFSDGSSGSSGKGKSARSNYAYV